MPVLHAVPAVASLKCRPDGGVSSRPASIAFSPAIVIVLRKRHVRRDGRR